MFTCVTHSVNMHMYAIGVRTKGTAQSFQKANLWYTQALDRGHTPAAYTLAIMHLNGVGTVRTRRAPLFIFHSHA